jgi:site-specific DNA recombinase
MKAALYARVSTDMQNEGYSIDAQKELLKKYCEIKQIESTTTILTAVIRAAPSSAPCFKGSRGLPETQHRASFIVYKLDSFRAATRHAVSIEEYSFRTTSISYPSVKTSTRRRTARR